MKAGGASPKRRNKKNRFGNLANRKVKSNNNKKQQQEEEFLSKRKKNGKPPEFYNANNCFWVGICDE